MQDSQDRVREAMRTSMKENATQVAITEESRLLLQAGLKTDMQQAVADGIKQALNKEVAEQFVSVFMEQMQIATTRKVDAWTGGIVRSAIKRALTFMVVGSIVYSIGGWTALATMIKWIVSQVSR